MFDFITKSRFFGRPIELYKFQYGDHPSNAFLFTDAEFPVTRTGAVPTEIYQPTPISRATVTNSGTLDKSAFEVVVTRDNPVAEMFRVYPPSRVVTVTIYQGEAEDPDAEFKPLWSGRILAVGWDGSQAKLQCEPISTSLTRVGLRRNFQYMCPHMLYGPQCGASKAAATVSRTIQSASGNTVTLGVELTNPDHYRGGLLQWLDSQGIQQSRTITNVSGATLTINGVCSLPSLWPVTITKGCTRLITFCRDVHNNVPNFGGQPWIPLKNPASNISPWS